MKEKEKESVPGIEIGAWAIVPAAEEDRRELMALYKAQHGRLYCPWDEEYPSEADITYDLSRDSLFVMKLDGGTGRIIASITLDQDEQVEQLDCWRPELQPGGELSRLAVAPDFQNRGLARKMLQFGMEELKRRGFRSTHFLVNRNNVKALRSYAVLEFDVVGECELYGQPFLCYEKAL